MALVVGCEWWMHTVNCHNMRRACSKLHQFTGVVIVIGCFPSRQWKRALVCRATPSWAISGEPFLLLNLKADWRI